MNADDGRATPGALADSGARIVDRGYQHYTGERRGVAWSVLAIATGSMRRSLGFKRPGSAKILPFLLVLFAFFPGVAVVGFRVLFPVRVLRRVAAPDQLFSYDSYFTFLRLVVLVLAALAAAEALCPDRRQRVLSLYYASPIRPLLYLLGQVLAVTTVLLLVALLPPLLLWVANVGLADDSLPYLRDHMDQAARIIATGSLIALLYAALGLAVASFTDRRAYAAGTLLGGVLVISAAAGIVRGVTKERWAEYTGLVDPLYLPTRLGRWIFGLTLETSLSGYLFLIATLAVIAIALAVLIQSYRAVRF
jgi:ABC-2 type transport system permease protein